MASFLSRDAILQANDLKSEEVDVPEWGGKVKVRSMTGEERDAFEESTIQGKGKNRDVNMRNFRAKLVVRCVVDELGERIFGETDIQALAKKNSGAISRVFDVASRLSGLSKEDVDELTKNSEADQSDDSTSASA